jgi:glycine oxidase
VGAHSSFDAIVVGGGIVGLACAYRAQQRGLNVCVVERDRPGAAATWAAAGMLAPVTEAEQGSAAALRLYVRAAEAWPGFAEELRLPYRRPGTLVVARDEDEVAELKELEAYRAEHGMPSEWVDADTCRELEPGLGSCVGGALHEEEAEVDPRAVVAALLEHVEVTPAEIVGAIVEGDAIRGVRTAAGDELRAESVVVASGAWGASWLPDDAQPPVRPVKGQILRLRGERVCERIVGCIDVWVLSRENGETVIGATVEERGYDTTVTAGGVLGLLRDAQQLLPKLAELELVEASAAPRPGSPDDAPIVGRGSLDGLIVATGHYRNGILLAPLTAEAVVSLLAGEEPTGWDAFAPSRLAARKS